MKQIGKVLGAALAITLLAVMPAAAGEKKKETSESSAGVHHASGTITAWDASTKAVTVKSSAGEKTFTWSDATKVMGTPKVGEHVKLAYTKAKDGAIKVTEIATGEHAAHHDKTAKK